jgi:hypothetical protein
VSDKSDFIAYPYGYIFAVIDDPSEAEGLERQLAEDGFDRDEMLCLTGEEGARRIDASGRGHGLFARLVRLLEYTDDSRLHAEAYEREARAGRCVMGVHAPNSEQREHVRAALKERGGHFINYYSRGGFTETLDP